MEKLWLNIMKCMDSYEKENTIKYDYVNWFRTDIVLKDHINFNWMNYDNEQIKNILYKPYLSSSLC